MGNRETGINLQLPAERSMKRASLQAHIANYARLVNRQLLPIQADARA
jgi:hypothetical protein